MPSLKDLRNRIASVKATQKITKAMQMVAAAKLRRAQSAAEAARPFAERMATVLGNLAAGITVGPETPRLLAVVLETDPRVRLETEVSDSQHDRILHAAALAVECVRAPGEDATTPRADHA